MYRPIHGLTIGRMFSVQICSLGLPERLERELPALGAITSLRRYAGERVSYRQIVEDMGCGNGGSSQKK